MPAYGGGVKMLENKKKLRWKQNSQGTGHLNSWNILHNYIRTVGMSLQFNLTLAYHTVKNCVSETN